MADNDPGWTFKFERMTPEEVDQKEKQLMDELTVGYIQTMRFMLVQRILELKNRNGEVCEGKGAGQE